MSISQATQQPITLTVKGTNYEFSPLTIADWGKLEQWLRSSVLNIAREQAEQTTDKQVKQMMLETAWKEALKISLAASTEFLNNPAAFVYIAYLSLKKKQTNMTFEDVENLLDTVDDAMEIIQPIMKMSGQPDDSPTTNNAQSDEAKKNQ